MICIVPAVPFACGVTFFITIGGTRAGDIPAGVGVGSGVRVLGSKR